MTYLTAQYLKTVQTLNQRLPSRHAMKMLARLDQRVDDASLNLLQLVQHALDSGVAQGSYANLWPTVEELHRIAQRDPERAYRRLISNALGDSLMQPFVATRTPDQAQQYLLGLLVA